MMRDQVFEILLTFRSDNNPIPVSNRARLVIFENDLLVGGIILHVSRCGHIVRVPWRRRSTARPPTPISDGTNAGNFVYGNGRNRKAHTSGIFPDFLVL